MRPVGREVSYDRAKIERLREAIRAAKPTVGRNGVITFEGEQYVIAYAEYLIEYLDTRIPGGPDA